MKHVSWIFFAVSFGFFVPASLFYFCFHIYKFSESPSFIYFVNHFNAASVAKTGSVELLFVGDIMMSREVENSIYENQAGDFSKLFKKADWIKEADVSFGNLEGPVSDFGQETGNLYSFKFKPDALNALIGAGFGALSVANNHAGDWGSDAFRENIFRLKNAAIVPVGGGMNKDEASGVKIIEKNGVKIGFLGFSDVGPEWFEAGENRPGILIVKDDFAFLVKKAAKQADILVVSFHFGEEYQKNSSERQKFLARATIDNGAKIVVGHHPHVVQEVESYNGGIIAYSLGNFIFDQNFSEETMEGLVLRVYVQNNEIIAIKQNRVKLNEFFQPKLAE
ncbi:CapA family protein [Patescibacteria group bacterium]|nr:CapA family protein [Patescibacteria group bacterium]